MSEEEVKHVFDPFWQSDSALSRSLNPLGNGLGLSICKQICQSLDGDIHVRSKPDYGSQFTFTMKVFKSYTANREEVSPSINRAAEGSLPPGQEAPEDVEIRLEEEGGD